MKKIKIHKWGAVVFYDDDTGSYTITSDKIGGAIICNSNYSVAVSLFKSAMTLCDNIRKLERFKETGILSEN